MPFCTQCGTEVQPDNVFCAACGARQSAGRPAAPSQPSEKASPASDRAEKASQAADDFLKKLTPRKASLLCYIPLVGWVFSIVVLASHKYRTEPDVRFHAFQGLYLFVLWLFVDWVFGPMTAFSESTRHVSGLLRAVVFGCWIFMLVKTSHGENFHLPILGELADRSVHEQK